MPLFNRYHYEPLCTENSIRLLVLDPAIDKEAPLSCSIIQHQRSKQTTDDFTDYTAVSYTWGEPEFSRSLEIRCDDDTSYIRITLNVDTLLRRFRASKEPRCLWIDAICLNQTDEMETAQQVPMMGHIYGGAKEVDIWLGPANDTTATLFRFFRMVCRLREVKQVEMATHLARLMRSNFGGGDGLTALKSILEFSERAWLSRRWVIQEACLARQAVVHCGKYSIPLPLLALAAKRLQSLDMSSYPIKMMANLGRLTSKPHMLELLWNFHEADCLEHKDRIAALLGLVSDRDRFPLDYTLHWTDIYKRLASFMFKLGNNDIGFQMLLHLFEFGPVTRPEDITYPSWVPDWSKSRRRLLPYYSSIRNPDTHEPYHTSPGDSRNFKLSFNYDNLQIHWHASICGSHGRRVLHANKFDTFSRDGNARAERVLHVFHELFPSTSGSALQILALAALLEEIVSFRHSNRDQELYSPAFDVYIINMHRMLPESFRAAVSSSLRKIDSVLQDFCLFELEVYGPSSGISGGYGIGPHQIQITDVMLPLWDLKVEPSRHQGRLSREVTAFHMATMLAVRPVREPTPQYENSIPDRGPPVGKGRVIGPVLCIMLRREHFSQGPTVDSNHDTNPGKDQIYSMSLV